MTGNAAPGQPGGTNDVDGGATSLYSPVYDLTGADSAKVKYWRWYSNDKGNNPNSDTWVVQVRNNGGPGSTSSATRPTRTSWILKGVDVLALFGDSARQGPVQVRRQRRRLRASQVEACIDDFELLVQLGPVGRARAGDAAGALRVPRAAAATRSRRAPRSASRCRRPCGAADALRRERAGDPHARGQAFNPGVHPVVWDGTDGNGSAVASGVYYCRMQSAGFTAVRPVVLSR